jgi:ketosteroid isomerase-like protein
MNRQDVDTQGTVQDVHLVREGLFACLDDAFMRRDFAAFDKAVREDVVTELPGTSWLAGTHNGRETFGRFVVAMRQVLRSTEKPARYVHEGDQMMVEHDVLVMGPRHQVEMTLRIDMRFDTDGKISSAVVAPEDLALFDHVANSIMHDVQTLDAH